MCLIKIILSPIIAYNLYNSTLNNVNRRGIYQMFYISKITKCFNFTLENQVNRDIVGNKLRIGDVWLIYFGQVVSFCAIIYPNKNSLNSCMPECGKFQRIGNIFVTILINFTRAKIYFNQMTFVTNSTSECECIRQRKSWQCCPVSHRDCQSFLNQGQELSFSICH